MCVERVDVYDPNWRESELAETVLEEDTAVLAEDETLEEGVAEKEISEKNLPEVSETEKESEKEIGRIMGNLMAVLKDQNATADALRKYFAVKKDMVPTNVIPFSSDRKYSGASFKEQGTYLMGAAQFCFRKETKLLWKNADSMQNRDFEFLFLRIAQMKVWERSCLQGLYRKLF